ncbi:hypothetical protein SAICODRAFT_24301 [Saitoella complicata NRRL Y-17804]|uniref:uncharacterized protein n=1 Tax=Saitoella complicata (strain BCRC 22490 / CBS 7301 / JCM 7358 / NBRC 10748 / NRRL Y-17804) TaxID=698492 RepID=UPI000867DA70|nr:uncharacterized protein SAICODRAFT_24301 [Saitoella complicata NRRL Y-17804]ODQ54524.1 hypothetical protein SAICODRAFT_24301 [Saitoella complicata NRRL Y-17804]
MEHNDFNEQLQSTLRCSYGYCCLKLRSYASFEALNAHIRNTPGHECYDCTCSGQSVFFRTEADLLHHRHTNCGFAGQDELQRFNREMRTFSKCPYCSRKYGFFEALEAHLRATAVHGFWYKDCCKMYFPDEQSMHQHQHTGSRIGIQPSLPQGSGANVVRGSAQPALAAAANPHDIL